jgi:hypothetical protein
MMSFDQVSAATLEELTDELAAAGLNPGEIGLEEARDNVARLLNSVVGLALFDSETARWIRPATDDEAAESANSGPEGHILVAGRKCYVV